MDNWTKGNFQPTKLQALILGKAEDLECVEDVLEDQIDAGKIDLIEALDDFYRTSDRYTDLLEKIYATNRSESVRRKALHKLVPAAADDARVFSTLLAAVNDPNPFTQVYAIELLANFPGKADRVVPALLSAVGSKIPNVHLKAIDVLSKFTGQAEQIVPVLAKFIEGPNQTNRDAAIRALSSFHQRLDLVEPVLRKALRSDSETVRRTAENAIKDLGL
jgi:HEAT repeat protein